MLDTVDYIIRDPQGAARGMAEWTGIPERQALLQIEALQPVLARDLLPSDEGLREVIEAERVAAGVTREVAPSEVTSFALLQEVLRERAGR
jgi:hypothetical protein